MRDHILESIFLDTALWRDAVAHGVEKRVDHGILERLADPHFRADLCVQIAEGDYRIQPPHTGYRKKDDGGERMFLANEPLDRLLLNVIYRWLMRNEASMIHPSCKSYRSGIGIGAVVREIARRTSGASGNGRSKVVGRKFDIHKYFDTIGREHIHAAFDAVERHHGPSSVIDLLRAYYDSDLYYDTRRRVMVEGYMGIKQGCAVSSWLANALLYPLDEELSQRGGGLYVRYSDDILYLGDDYDEATMIIRDGLSLVGLRLNERKIADVVRDEYFRFLGFEIHGADISLSHKWVKHFQHEVEKRTIGNAGLIGKVRTVRRAGGVNQEQKLMRLLNSACRNLAQFLLYGDGHYSWATMVLPTVNNQADLRQLTVFCLDALRAVYTGHTHIGGLGKSHRQGIQRGTGRNVKANRIATRHLENNHRLLGGFISLCAVQRTIANKWLFRCVAVNLVDKRHHTLYGRVDEVGCRSQSPQERLSRLEALYATYLASQPDGDNKVERFYAPSLDEMTQEALIGGTNRQQAFEALERYLASEVDFATLPVQEGAWYWQSATHPQLVLLREWFAAS